MFVTVKRSIALIVKKKIYQFDLEIFLYDVLVEWMQLTDMHNSVVLPALLGLVIFL